MPHRFPLRPQPTSTRPAAPVCLIVEPLEDRLSPGSLLSAGLPALVDLPAADSNPPLHRIAMLDEPTTHASTGITGEVSLAPTDGSLLTASRETRSDGAHQRQPVASATESVAAPSSTDLPSPLAASESALDRAPSEANLSALVLGRIASGEGKDQSQVFGAVSAPVAAPDAELPRAPVVTAPPVASLDPAGSQQANLVPVAFPDGSQGGDQTPPPPGHSAFRVSPNVRANSRFVCPGNQGTIQSETAVAESGKAVIVAYNDFRGFYCPTSGTGFQVTGWAYSLDRGHTFTDGGPLPGAQRQLLRGDPELAVGPDGTFYLISLYNPLSAMAVLRGNVNDTGTGISWSNPTIIQTHNEGYDKENVAVDPNTGTIYITYTRFGSLGSGIGLYVSHDGGLTFAGPTSVVNTGGVQGSVPVVGPNGELYVAYNIGYPSDSGIGFVASYDGGQTFSAPRQIAPTRSFAVPGADRSPSFPHMAVDTSGGPYTGNIYVSWQSAIGTGNTGEAVLTTSQNGGATWSSPQIINNDGGSGIEWMPTVSADSQGNVDSFFYSRRAHPGTMLTDLYFAQSTDGGQTFLPAFPVTTVSSNWHGSGDGFPAWGDYINATTVGTKALVAYADGRDGDPDAYFIRVTPKNR